MKIHPTNPTNKNIATTDPLAMNLSSAFPEPHQTFSYTQSSNLYRCFLRPRFDRLPFAEEAECSHG